MKFGLKKKDRIVLQTILINTKLVFDDENSSKHHNIITYSNTESSNRLTKRMLIAMIECDDDDEDYREMLDEVKKRNRPVLM